MRASAPTVRSTGRLVRNAFGSRLEEHRLTADRAGVISQRFASERLDRYLRSNVRQLGLALALLVLLSGAMWLLLSSRPGNQGLATSFLAGFGLAFLYHWCVIASGAAPATMGGAAEEWTSTELRRLRRKGWKHVNHVVIKPQLGDIDHVAVGPDGVIVVETKWQSTGVDVDDLAEWMRSAVVQARENRDQVRQLLNWQRREPLLIQSLVVLWGPEVTHESAEAVLDEEADVNVIAGQHLRDELAALSDQRLSPDEVNDVYAQLCRRIEARDKWESKHNDPRPPTLQEQARRWAWNAGSAWAGLWLSLLTLRFGWWAIPLVAALLFGGGAARRSDRLQARASWFIGGVAATLPLILILAGWMALS